VITKHFVTDLLKKQKKQKGKNKIHIQTRKKDS